MAVATTTPFVVTYCIFCLHLYRVDSWESEQDGWKRTREILSHLQGKVSAEYKGNCVLSLLHLVYYLTILLPDQSVTIKMLCGADLLESFSKPGLWASEDVCLGVS